MKDEIIVASPMHRMVKQKTIMVNMPKQVGHRQIALQLRVSMQMLLLKILLRLVLEQTLITIGEANLVNQLMELPLVSLLKLRVQLAQLLLVQAVLFFVICHTMWVLQMLLRLVIIAKLQLQAVQLRLVTTPILLQQIQVLVMAQ